MTRKSNGFSTLPQDLRCEPRPKEAVFAWGSRRRRAVTGLAAELRLPGFFGSRSRRALRLNRLCLGVLFLEAIHSALGVYKLLPACEKRMATGADFHVYVAFVSGACHEF